MEPRRARPGHLLPGEPAFRSDQEAHLPRPVGQERMQGSAVHRLLVKEKRRSPVGALYGSKRTGSLDLGKHRGAALLQRFARHPSQPLHPAVVLPGTRHDVLADQEHDPRNTRLGSLADNEIDFPAFWQALQERQSNRRRAGGNRRENGRNLHVALLPPHGRDAHCKTRTAGIHRVEGVTLAQAQHTDQVAEVTAAQGDPRLPPVPPRQEELLQVPIS